MACDICSILDMCSCAIANNGGYSSFLLVFDNVRHALIFEHNYADWCFFFAF